MTHLLGKDRMSLGDRVLVFFVFITIYRLDEGKETYELSKTVVQR